MLTKEERQAYVDRVAARKVYWESGGNSLLYMSTSRMSHIAFDYPVRFDGETAIITVHKTFQKQGLADRDYDVMVDMDVYNRLKGENRRLFIHPYIGEKWHRHENVVSVKVDMTEKRPDHLWSLSWYVLGHRSEPGAMADHINGDDLDNRKVNLRWATHEQNMQNRPGWNKYSSHPGISFKKDTGKWDVCIHRSFQSLEDAEAFSEAVHSSVFGQYARDSTAPK